MTAAPAPAMVALRPPDQVMRLERLGASHQTRLSFLRALLRRIAAEGWRIARHSFAIDRKGAGTAICTVGTGPRMISPTATRLLSAGSIACDL
jgi:hypothetical protein